MTGAASLQPTARAIAVLGLGLGLAVAPALVSAALWPLWLAFCALVLAACGVDGVMCPRTGELDFKPELPRLVYMGCSAPVRVRLALPVPWPVPAEATLDVSETLEPIRTMPLALSREPAMLEAKLRPRRRGRAKITDLWVRYAGPLGLMRRTARHELGHEVAAVPDVGFLHAPGLAAYAAKDAFVGLKIERYNGDGTDFHALRAFVPGLAVRSIAWKASARHNQLLAREYRAERNHPIVMAIDTGHLMAEPVGGTPLLDHAIHGALVLSHVSLRHGDRVGLFGFDQKPHTFQAPRSGPRTMTSLLELTSRLAYTRAETNFTLGLTDLATRLARRSLVVVLTDFIDSVSAELMIDNLLRLGRRHLLIFVAFRDPLLEQRIAAEPRSLHDVDLAITAESLVREREVVLRRLRRAGILVVEDEPRKISTQLLNRYLEAKRRELI